VKTEDIIAQCIATYNFGIIGINSGIIWIRIHGLLKLSGHGILDDELNLKKNVV